MKKFNYWSLLLLLPFVFGFSVALFEDNFYTVEKAVFDFLRNLAPAFDIPFRALTELGSAVGVILVTVIIFIVSAITKKYFFTFGLPVAITAIVSRVINITIKNTFMRPRPDFKVLEASESSFPSGHSQNNMALYIAILLVALLIVTLPKWRTVLKITLIALPLIIGITRIYFGVHYISDVIAGWGLGAFVAILTNFVYFKIYYALKEKKNAQA
ncbi:MAG: phosphatase PAP2 family protein [Acutalibacteraceae bacterium]|nr:phosphatase PAP2 family protein [Acutalibacteraceae bacterium]